MEETRVQLDLSEVTLNDDAALQSLRDRFEDLAERGYDVVWTGGDREVRGVAVVLWAETVLRRAERIDPDLFLPRSGCPPHGSRGTRFATAQGPAAG